MEESLFQKILSNAPIGVSNFTHGFSLSTGLEYKNWFFKVQYDLSINRDSKEELPFMNKESLLFSVIYSF